MQKQLSTLKIQTSNSCKELFHNFNAILGKKNSTPLSSSLDSDDTPQAFSEYFTNWIITIRNSFPPLNPTVDMDKITYSGKLLQTFTPVNEQFVGTCAVCFVQYSTFRHHSQSLSQPSAFCRRHPTSKINSTKWCAKPYTRPAIMYRWHKSMDVQQPTQT